MIELEKSSVSIKSGEEGTGLLKGGNQEVPLVHFTWRSVIAGVLVGGLMCFSNMYFGLQTGWVTMGSLQSTILGFLAFRLVGNFLTRHNFHFAHFTYLENVVLQTAAVATATMPLAGGFVGIIPALELQGTRLNAWQLILWSFAIAFFGVFFAVPLRVQTILKEKLKFPSGTATAQMIKTLHKINEDTMKVHDDNNTTNTMSDSEDNNEKEAKEAREESEEWNRKLIYLLVSFGASSIVLLATYFVPILGSIPIMTWIGLSGMTKFYWTLTPSLSYVGQGMIMGPKTGLSMILGALFGWGILGPIANHKGWAKGPVDDWQTGAKGWLMWTSLAIMLGESLSSLSIVLFKSIKSFIQSRRRQVNRDEYGVAASSDDASSDISSDVSSVTSSSVVSSSEPASDIDPAPADQQVPRSWWLTGLIVSVVLCTAILAPLFSMPVYEPLIATLIACLTSVLAVRALGETDLNPVSGIGKVSQIAFAAIAPGNLVANLVAGAISEAGAQQAGDLMQDLKTGHLLRASPRAQFYAQLIGSFFSVFFTVAAYLLYSNAYEIPSDTLPAPTAMIWLDMAKLMNGGSLPHMVGNFCVICGVIAALFPIAIAILPKLEDFLPSCVAFAVGMYVTPNWTIARVIGSLVDYLWKKYRPQSHEKYMIIIASGFVLGEGITSIFTAGLKSLHVYPNNKH